MTGRAGAFDKAQGDRVYASTFLRAGRIVVRVSKLGTETLTGYIGAQLPHGGIQRLPSSAEAEAIVNRMVVPALAVSGLNLLLTGVILPSQATIRPDYATGPRLSAQLAALYALSDALRRGILFRDPAAMDRLPATDIYVFDDSSALTRGRIGVGEVISTPDISPNVVLSYAASAFPAFQNERARALLERCTKDRAPLLEISARAREAGLIRYRDDRHRLVEVATPAYPATTGVEIPAMVESAIAALRRRGLIAAAATTVKGSLMTIQRCARSGSYWMGWSWALSPSIERVNRKRPRPLRLSGRAIRGPASSISPVILRPKPKKLGIEWDPYLHGNLDTEGKVRILKNLGRRTMWIGNGSSPSRFPLSRPAP